MGESRTFDYTDTVGFENPLHMTLGIDSRKTSSILAHALQLVLRIELKHDSSLIYKRDVYAGVEKKSLLGTGLHRNDRCRRACGGEFSVAGGFFP